MIKVAGEVKGKIEVVNADTLVVDVIKFESLDEYLALNIEDLKANAFKRFGLGTYFIQKCHIVDVNKKYYKSVSSI